MTFHVTYANGAAEEVPRCFLVETRGENGEWTRRWLVQRANGLKVALPDEAIAGLQFRPEGIPEPWHPAPSRP